MNDHREIFDSQPPGFLFAERELLNVTRIALGRIYAEPGPPGSENMRECARQALARLEGRTSLDDLGPRYAVRGHYHDASGHEDTLCQCPEPGRYAPVPEYDPGRDD